MGAAVAPAEVPDFAVTGICDFERVFAQQEGIESPLPVEGERCAGAHRAGLDLFKLVQPYSPPSFQEIHQLVYTSFYHSISRMSNCL